GFRSSKGFPFAAIVKLTPEFKTEFDFGNDTNADGTAATEVDFTGKEPVGQCPKCKARVFENGMNYICEKATGPNKTCDFRSGAIILQQPIDRAQMSKLLSIGKTDLLQKFISKKTGRAFKAYLALDKEGKTGFEFEAREPKGKGKPGEKKPKAPVEKFDFTGQEPVGKCPKCGGNVFETKDSFICEKSQVETKSCKFKIGKTILEQPVNREQAKKLLADKKSDLLDKFISKAGRAFPAWLIMDAKGKITFEFPERKENLSA
ncbi:MAG: topoisomerase C-terminal repeat-containing protein, partial [Limisphaerales bacterium]